MKRSILLIFIILCGTVVFAGDKNKPAAKTRTVTGKVIDKISGEEIAGAEIRLTNDVVVYSDLNGNFNTTITEEKNTAVVSFISYTETKIALHSFSYLPLIIELEPR